MTQLHQGEPYCTASLSAWPMNAMSPPAMGPNRVANKAPSPYAVWKLVSGTGDGTFTYMNKSIKMAAPRPVATMVRVVTLNISFMISSFKRNLSPSFFAQRPRRTNQSSAEMDRDIVFIRVHVELAASDSVAGPVEQNLFQIQKFRDVLVTQVGTFLFVAFDAADMQLRGMSHLEDAPVDERADLFLLFQIDRDPLDMTYRNLDEGVSQRMSSALVHIVAGQHHFVAAQLQFFPHDLSAGSEIVVRFD